MVATADQIGAWLDGTLAAAKSAGGEALYSVNDGVWFWTIIRSPRSSPAPRAI